MALPLHLTDLNAHRAQFEQLENAIQETRETLEALEEKALQLATSEETRTGTDTEKAVTPKGLADTLATHKGSEGTSGLLQLASTTEAIAGADATKAVTPLGVKTAVAGGGYTFRSVGSGAATNYLLANGTDLSNVFVRASRVSPSGSGAYITGIGLSVSSGTMTLTYSKGGSVYSNYSDAGGE